MVKATSETSDELRKRIADLHKDAARLRGESDRLLKLSVRLAEQIERMEKAKSKR